MKAHDHIIKQLNEQHIDFELIQDEHSSVPESEASKVGLLWSVKFIGDRKAPHVDKYRWHIFSYGVSDCMEKEAAIVELKKQFHADTFIFNERLQYLIRCKNKIPIIETNDFSDDIYISHHNMKWTYVVTHEADFGPFFSTGN